MRVANLRLFISQLEMEAAKQWVNWDPNTATREYIENLVKQGNVAELTKRLGKRLEFGTAGLRGPMGAGTCFMNDLVVIQTTQGLYKYLKAEFGSKLETMGVAVGYDHRRCQSLHSQQFAHYIAAVLTSRGVPVYLFPLYVPTPFVSFCVDLKQCAAGIMVTASHNPKLDNGYKLYWSNGCQIVSPRDSDIAASICKNLEPWETYSIDQILQHPLVRDPTCEVVAAYYTRLAATLCRYKLQNAKPCVKIAYTAMHGVGHPWASKALEAFGLAPFITVPSQTDPDPEFPTVKCPNPEEGQRVLTLAFETAEGSGCSLVLANDPDADRLAVAERTPDGTWKVFTGNEIATLLGQWEWVQLMRTEPDINPANVYIVASAVSSKMLSAVAKKHGFNYEETLAGFKHMSNRSVELTNAGKRVIFSFEESLGYCVGSLVRDKDGISAAAVFAEMANELAQRGMSVNDHLTWLYDTYGYFVEKNYYVKSYDPLITASIFDRLRNNGAYFSNCGPYQIVRVRDQTLGYDTGEPDKRAKLPPTPTVHWITYTFAEGYVATLRMSGTEPKIKYYIEKYCAPGENMKAAHCDVAEFAAVFIEEMLQPFDNQLDIYF